LGCRLNAIVVAAIAVVGIAAYALGGDPWRSDPSTAATTPTSSSLRGFAAAAFGVIPSRSS
jgi:hypothetical protein